MPLHAQHVKSAQRGDPFPEFDIGAAPRHVGRDRQRSTLSGARDDLRLLFIALSVEHLRRVTALAQRRGQRFRFVDAAGADEDGDRENSIRITTIWCAR